MAFPQDPLPIKGEMFINSTWVDVTSRMREEADVEIAGGRQDEQGKMTPCTCGFTINNRDGLYSNDNPLSAYYQLLPSNTPFRVSITETTPWLRLPAYLNNYVSPATFTWAAPYIQTTDKAVLDIVGDIDIRIEIEPDQWNLGGVGQVFAGKYDNSPGNQRSWMLTMLPTGRPRLIWSNDGTATFAADATAELPRTGRIALRATLDVDNGAGGRTTTFYTSTSILGSWTVLGSPIATSSGTTSIFSSSAALQVGAVRNTAGTYPFSASTTDLIPMTGRVYRFQLYSGISGTLVADMNATSRSAGDTSWSDGLGTPNTWTAANGAVVATADYRAYGEISEMPQEWDSTGRDIYVPMQASGIMRRITQGSSPLNSAIYRNLRQYIGAGALQWIPLEDGSRSTSAASAIPNQQAAFIREVDFGEEDDFPATAGTGTLGADNAIIRASITGAPASSQTTMIFYYKYPVTPLADIEVMHLYTTGTVARLTFTVGSGTYRITAYGRDGTNLGSGFSSFGTGLEPGQWLACQMKITTNGAGVDCDLGWYAIGKDQYAGIAPLNIASASIGRPSGWATAGGAALGRVKYAQVMNLSTVGFDFLQSAFSRSSRAYLAEPAGDRFLRILAEEGLLGLLVGWSPDTELMGPQPVATLPDILEEIEDVDGGPMYEARDQAAIVYRTRRSLYTQSANTLDYAADHLSGSFRPTNDDRLTRNDVTAKRTSGSSATVTQDTGPKSVLPPPSGVGRYDVEINTNTSTDARLVYMAGQAVFLGTWPGQRVPNIGMLLERSVFVANPTLTAAMRSLNPGDRLAVANTPLWVGGGTADTMVQGYDETLRNRGHELKFSTSPYGPYLAYNNLTLGANTRYRLSAVNSTLTSGITSGQTSFSVSTPAANTPWGSTASKPGNFPLDIMIGGERMTVSGIGAWSAGAQTFTISARAVNGIAKAHLAGAVVQVFDIFYAAL